MVEQEIARSTSGFVGFELIGNAVAKRVHVFDIKIFYNDVKYFQEALKTYIVNYINLKQPLLEFDIISIHVLLLNNVLGLIGEKELNIMKK